MLSACAYRGVTLLKPNVSKKFQREFVPYIGIYWQRKPGDSAEFTRDEGTQVDDFSLLAGLRVWF